MSAKVDTSVEVKVERMISWEEAAALENAGKRSIGVKFGGWFGADSPMRWKDYLVGYDEYQRAYCEAFHRYILEQKLKRGGDYHQESDHGAPLFSDGRAAAFSMRAWGDIMAAIWSEEENKDYSYLTFYMDDFIWDENQ